ncbi:MAG: peptidase [Deltaproteobacteria bacterium RBG_16_48_10]|nr:MAG: peptidase [Deltaproteobacteria bacterium RBG_16_48_10]
MTNRKMLKPLTVVLILICLGTLMGLGYGCDQKREKGKAEVIGFPQSFTELVEKVRPAVVNISATTTVHVPGHPFRHFFGPREEGPFSDFFKRFFGDIPDREFKQQSLGSGFIVDKDGYIITNNHVVEKADEIKVKLSEGKEYKAKVIGRDSKTDLALIKISSLFGDLPTLPLGESDKVKVGEWVLAVGNPFGLEHTVTKGIISATGRVIGSGPYDNFLQTDAPINPGNSGGPLINLRGEVIGINTAIVASGQGIGFAIPSNLAQQVFNQLKEKGKVFRGWIGVSIQSVTPEMAESFSLKEPRGALVGDVVPGGPAEAGGIQRGDVIVGFDGKGIKDASDLPRIVAETPIKKTVMIKVIREGREVDLKVIVAEMEEEKTASMKRKAPEQHFGMMVDEITSQRVKEFNLRDRTGVVILQVAPGSPAEEANLQAGDVIKEIGRKPVRNLKDYEEGIAKMQRSKSVLFFISRGGQTFYASIKIF